MEKKFSELEEGVDYIDLANNEKNVIWILPESAADTIMETLSIDARSLAIDTEIREEISVAYDSIKTVEIEAIKMLVDALQDETQPMRNHDDPGAIDDCWNTLREIFGFSNETY
jgi:hypothetical protein|tara:strand:+ start:255 stop:596 length:342 start_codon:yes stop_codon:yes gene_type:complete